MEPMYNFGIQLIQALQALGLGLEGVMNFFTSMGRIEFCLLVIRFFNWVVDVRLEIRTFLLLKAFGNS